MKKQPRQYRDPMDDDDIIRIAKRNGRFNVSLRWRDIPLQKQCNRLVREGKLQKVGRVKREIRYIIPLPSVLIFGDSITPPPPAPDSFGDLNASYGLYEQAVIHGTGIRKIAVSEDGEIKTTTVKREDFYEQKNPQNT